MKGREGSGADNTVNELLIFVRNGVQMMKEREMCDISKEEKNKKQKNKLGGIFNRVVIVITLPSGSDAYTSISHVTKSESEWGNGRRFISDEGWAFDWTPAHGTCV